MSDNRFRMTTIVTPDNGDRIVFAWTLVKQPTGHRWSVSAHSMLEGKTYTYPADYDKLCELVPRDMWPAFTNETHAIPRAFEDQERLF